MRSNKEKGHFLNAFEITADLEVKKNNRVAFLRNSTVYRPIKKSTVPFLDGLVFVHKENGKWKSRTNSYAFHKTRAPGLCLDETNTVLIESSFIEGKTFIIESIEERSITCGKPKKVIEKKTEKLRKREERKEILNEFDLNPW